MCNGHSTHGLQSLNCPDDLPDLVGFGHTPVVPDVYPGITRPGSPIYPVVGASLSRISEESVTDSGEVIEPDSFRVGAKPVGDFFSTFHTP